MSAAPSAAAAALLLLSSSALAETFHLSVTGRDDPDGGRSESTAWRTWAFATPRLSPGDTLEVHAGEWSNADGGLPYIDCNGAETNGQSGLPITLKGASGRMTQLRSDGRENGLTMLNCSHWVVDDFRISVGDAMGSTTGTGAFLRNCSDTVVRHILAKGQNR